MGKGAKLYSFDDFSTGLNTFDSIFADVGNPIDPNFGMKSAQEVVNVLMKKTGLEKAPGYGEYLNSAIAGAPTVTGIYRYSKTGSGATTEWIITAGAKIYTVSANAVTEIYSGLTTTSNYFTNFCTFNNVVIMCNGVDEALCYDGSSVTTLDTATGFTDPSGIFGTAKPSFAAVFRNRIFYGGDATYPHRIWTPRPGSHVNFDNGTSLVDSFDVSVGDGERLIFAKPISKDLMILYKEGSVHRLSGSTPFGSTSDAFRIEEISREVGCKSPRSIVQVGTDHLFIGNNGIKRLSLVQDYGDVSQADITEFIPDEVADWNTNVINEAFATFVKPEKQVWFHIATGSSSQNNKVYVFDMLTGAVFPRDGITAASGGMIGDTYYTGSYDGQIHQQVYTDGYAGDAIESSWESKWLPIGGLFNKKVFDNLLIYFENSGVATLTVQWQIMKMDGSVRTVSASSAATTNDVFDTGVWDTAVFDAGQDTVFKKNNLGRGRAIKLKIINNNVNERWKVRRIEFTVRNLGHVGA